MQQTITANEFKFVYKSGYVVGNTAGTTPSKFGFSGNAQTVSIYLTKLDRTKIIVPDSSDFRITILNPNVHYLAQSYSANSSEIHLFTTTPTILYSGEEFNLWYSEDLFNIFESDNEGTSCADVYVITKFPPSKELIILRNIIIYYHKSS